MKTENPRVAGSIPALGTIYRDQLFAAFLSVGFAEGATFGFAELLLNSRSVHRQSDPAALAGGARVGGRCGARRCAEPTTRQTRENDYLLSPKSLYLKYIRSTASLLLGDCCGVGRAASVGGREDLVRANCMPGRRTRRTLFRDIHEVARSLA